MQYRKGPRDDSGKGETGKAAAWAVFQHNGGGESVSRPSGTSARRATRFKVEAQKNVSKAEESIAMVRADPHWDCGSTLFDSYELVSFSKQLDEAVKGPPVRKSVSYHEQIRPPKEDKVFKSSLRLLLQRGSLCRSEDAVATREDVKSVAVARREDLKYEAVACSCEKYKQGKVSSWSFWKVSKALQLISHSPLCELHRHLHQHHHHFHHHHHHHRIFDESSMEDHFKVPPDSPMRQIAFLRRI